AVDDCERGRAADLRRREVRPRSECGGLAERDRRNLLQPEEPKRRTSTEPQSSGRHDVATTVNCVAAATVACGDVVVQLTLPDVLLHVYQLPPEAHDGGTRGNARKPVAADQRSGQGRPGSGGAELVAVAEMRLHGGWCDAHRVARVAEGHLVVAVLLSTGAVLVLRGARRLAL